MMEGKIPYGYRMAEGNFIVDDIEGNIVREIFLKYSEGMPQYKLIEHIRQFTAEHGYGDMTIKKQAVGDILKDRKYLGDAMYPQLIAAEVFEKVQMIRESRNIGRGRSKEWQELKEQHVFYERLYCGLCGSEFRLYRRKTGRSGKTMVWDCRQHLVESRIFCKNICVTEEDVKRSFLRVINYLQRNPSRIEKKIDGMPQKENARIKVADREIQALEQGITSCGADEWKRLICKRAALMYQEATIQDNGYYTKKLWQLLNGLEPQTEFCENLFRVTIKKVVVHPEYGMKFIFVNGIELTNTMLEK